jgi:hypothetical protein
MSLGRYLPSSAEFFLQHADHYVVRDGKVVAVHPVVSVAGAPAATTDSTPGASAGAGASAGVAAGGGGGGGSAAAGTYHGAGDGGDGGSPYDYEPGDLGLSLMDVHLVDGPGLALGAVTPTPASAAAAAFGVSPRSPVDPPAPELVHTDLPLLTSPDSYHDFLALQVLLGALRSTAARSGGMAGLGCTCVQTPPPTPT